METTAQNYKIGALNKNLQEEEPMTYFCCRKSKVGDSEGYCKTIRIYPFVSRHMKLESCH